MSGGGRTIWMPTDVAWMRRERNVRLAMKVGPDAWGVMLSLWLLAKEQRSRDGRVKFGYVSVGRQAFVDAERVEEVVAEAATVGALRDLRDDAEGVIECVVTDFEKDDRRGREAMKKADQRAAAAESEVGTQGDRTGQGAAESPVVPIRPPRGEERREVKNSNVEPDRLDESRRSIDVSELFAYWQQRCGRAHAKLTNDRRGKIKARLGEGYTVDQIRQAIDGAALDAFVDEKGKRFDDIELICRNGSKLESFIGRAAVSTTGSSAEMVRRIGARS